jgi:thiamine biosynthesis protein ThiI
MEENREIHEAVMVRFGELFLKSESVMKYYINTLVRNLIAAIEAAGMECVVEQHRGRIIVRGDDPDRIARVASRVFGIVGVGRCILTPPDREIIEETAARLAAEKITAGMSFAVRAKRSGMEGFTSQELGASTGARIYERCPGVRVDLTSPDYEVFVEARTFGGIVYDSQIPGPGGLPLGTQGKFLSLLSAGLDSSVATWMMMRRGCVPVFFHADGGRYAGADARLTTEKNLAALSAWCPGRTVRMTVVSLEPFYDALVASGMLRTRCILCKRFMLRAATAIALQEGVAAIMTGDNIGQVATQTLVNLGVVQDVVPQAIPLLRPLLTYDKEEIVFRARMIGTFRDNAGDLGCSIVPKHPSTGAKPEEIREDEWCIPLEDILKEALAHATVVQAYNGKIVEAPSL